MYLSYNETMKKRFGRKMYKLSLDGGMTCPNRDGTLGSRGCIFCAGGSGQFAAAGDNIGVQIESAKKRVAGKASGCGYIAYFQSYSNTYAPVSRLRAVFTEAIRRPDIDGLAIATRPDCLPDDVLELLELLGREKPLFVELGFQTCHESTAEYIRRGYKNCVFDKAVRDLKEIGADVAAHMIIGLPGESEQMIYETANYIGRSGADGIKLHLLHVLRGTDLYSDYLAGKFEVLDMDEYIRLLDGCIRRIPPEMTVHRLTGDGDKRHLAAPMWSGDKKTVLNSINAYFKAHGTVQGELFTKEIP